MKLTVGILATMAIVAAAAPMQNHPAYSVKTSSEPNVGIYWRSENDADTRGGIPWKKRETDDSDTRGGIPWKKRETDDADTRGGIPWKKRATDDSDTRGGIPWKKRETDDSVFFLARNTEGQAWEDEGTDQGAEIGLFRKLSCGIWQIVTKSGEAGQFFVVIWEEQHDFLPSSIVRWRTSCAR